MEIVWGVIIACSIIVVGIIEYTKEITKSKFKKVYKWLPVPLSIAVGFIPVLIADGFKFWPFVLASLLIFATSTIGHDVIIKFIKEKISSSED